MRLVKGSGSLSGEKNVPAKNDMGMMKKLLKFAMSSCVCASIAAATPMEPKQNAVSASTAKKVEESWRWTPETHPTKSSVSAENTPRTSPVSAFPNATDHGLTGETSTSSSVFV